MLTGEQMIPISQIPKALEIIENVQEISGDVWVNKHQCQRVADRFRAIGAGLNVDFSAASNGSNNMDYPAFDELLTVLRKGQALVSDNVQWTGIKGVLTWTDNREAFMEIHEELDTMKATFPFEGFSGDFETSSGIQRTAKLIQDAEKDLEEMKHLPQSLPATEKVPEALDLEKVAKVVLEKSEPSGDLPSYLKIDLSTIVIKDPVREQEKLSKQNVETYGWAIVCEGSWLGCDYAVKVFRSDESQWNKDQLLKEAGALMELRHPHIIRFIGFAQGANLCSLLMEMMPERDLRHFMKQRAAGRPFTRSQELDIITQIAKGMLYLHTQGYVHGDLKCSNILVKKHEPDYVEVKIGDLRYAQKLESAGGSSNIDKVNTVRRPRWTPPEALENYGGEKPTDDLLKQADVYGFAMTCYEVVTGNWPFQDERDRAALIKQIKAGERPKLPDDLQHSRLKGLIESCWHHDPTQRPAFEYICVLLVHIRSSMPAIITNKSSGIANVWNVIKQIPLLTGWLRGMRESAQAVDPPNPTTTWSGNLEKESGVEDDGAAIADALKIPACLKIEPETLKKVRRIGSGSFAKVYEATWLGCTFAVKRIKRFENAASVSTLQQELDFLIQLRHPYIIQMVGLSIDWKGRCMIVMEYMNGSLRDLINSRNKKQATAERHSLFEFHEVVGIITKLAQGMVFLHSRGVIHRDLKAPNVLCQEHAGSIDVKIVDFGVSQVIADARAAGVTTVGVGTGYWRAPEIFPTDANRSRECDVNLQAADVYSFAMTCYEILTGLVPFQAEFGSSLSKYDEVVKGVRPMLPPDLHYAGLNELITDCWQTDPVKRPDFARICTRLNAISPHC